MQGQALPLMQSRGNIKLAIRGIKDALAAGKWSAKAQQKRHKNGTTL